jgi:hypothetical protein
LAPANPEPAKAESLPEGRAPSRLAGVGTRLRAAMRKGTRPGASGVGGCKKAPARRHPPAVTLSLSKGLTIGTAAVDSSLM